jgi:geranylgeranyl pyrophosphate synthase
MSHAFSTMFEKHKRQIESQLAAFSSNEEVVAAEINCNLGDFSTASRYALSVGGKRIRPMLVHIAAYAVNQSSQDSSLNYPALAIELIHTYSLIHDDLPAMDDDDLRRGKPSCHKAFDEATAILAGDALHSRAFELLADAPDLSADQRIKMIKVLAAAAGPSGMVGGQAIDIAATDSDITLSQLQIMHEPRSHLAASHLEPAKFN